MHFPILWLCKKLHNRENETIPSQKNRYDEKSSNKSPISVLNFSAKNNTKMKIDFWLNGTQSNIIFMFVKHLYRNWNFVYSWNFNEDFCLLFWIFIKFSTHKKKSHSMDQKNYGKNNWKSSQKKKEMEQCQTFPDELSIEH
jgi:hypothetical protein